MKGITFGELRAYVAEHAAMADTEIVSIGVRIGHDIHHTETEILDGTIIATARQEGHRLIGFFRNGVQHLFADVSLFDHKAKPAAPAVQSASTPVITPQTIAAEIEAARAERSVPPPYEGEIHHGYAADEGLEPIVAQQPAEPVTAPVQP